MEPTLVAVGSGLPISGARLGSGSCERELVSPAIGVGATLKHSVDGGKCIAPGKRLRVPVRVPTWFRVPGEERIPRAAAGNPRLAPNYRPGAAPAEQRVRPLRNENGDRPESLPPRGERSYVGRKV